MQGATGERSGGFAARGHELFLRASSTSKRRAFFCGALRRDAEHDDGVGGDLGGEGGGGFAGVFLGPGGPDGGGGRSGIAEFFPRHADINARSGAVEQYEWLTAAVHS